MRKAATALRLAGSQTMPQGSRVAATLGFEPESRWDSRMMGGGAQAKRGSSNPNLCILQHLDFSHPLLITPSFLGLGLFNAHITGNLVILAAHIVARGAADVKLVLQRRFSFWYSVS